MASRRIVRRPVKVHEGDWYAVPLRSGGYGVGAIARTGKRGALFGYFFGPKRQQLPTLDDVRSLRAQDAIFCGQFGDLGIQNGEWPLIGRLDQWDRCEWPLPEFGRIEDEARGIAWIVSYANVDLSEQGEKRQCSVADARRLAADGTYGHGAVELVLTKRLSDPAPVMH